MSVTWTWCGFQIGDSLIHLHYLRKLAKRYPDRQWIHGVKVVHHKQMQEVIEDVPQITLANFDDRPREAVHIWKNAENFWAPHPKRDDYAGFHLEWFKHLSAKLGVETPFRNNEDLLFDYPALLRCPEPIRDKIKNSEMPEVLFVNSAPCSGQFRPYLSAPDGGNNYEYCDKLIELLASKYRVWVTWPTKVKGVECTLDYDLTCTGIGHVSLYTKLIVAIVTGPSWPTFNVWNYHTAKLRVLLNDVESINMSPNTSEHNKSIQDAENTLRQKGWL